MKTQIFQTREEFYARENKGVNGVSPEFAESNPDFEKKNETNKGCYNCSDCYECSGCVYCSGCSDCYECSDCSGCSGCSECSNCSNGSGCSNLKPDGKIVVTPIIENIHQTILEAVSEEGALNMSEWHICDTTHCRAGQVVHLAGEEGKALENETSTSHAAMMIYHASSDIPVSPVRFYESNEVAMEDIKRCAEAESQLKGKEESRVQKVTEQNDGSTNALSEHEGGGE